MNPTLPTFLDLLAIATSGLFGVAVAVRRQMPLVGVLLIGILSALGGGILRDLLLGVPVVAMRDQWYLPVAVGAAVIGMPLARRIIEHEWIGLVLDGLVLGLFTLVGTEKALSLGFPIAAAIFIGMLTSIGGGMLVELLVGLQPTVLQRGPWFASAALLGAVVVAISYGRLPETVVAVLGVGVVATLRVLSVRKGWAAPSVSTLQQIRKWLPGD